MIGYEGAGVSPALAAIALLLGVVALVLSWPDDQTRRDDRFARADLRRRRRTERAQARAAAAARRVQLDARLQEDQR